MASVAAIGSAQNTPEAEKAKQKQQAEKEGAPDASIHNEFEVIEAQQKKEMAEVKAKADSAKASSTKPRNIDNENEKKDLTEAHINSEPAEPKKEEGVMDKFLKFATTALMPWLPLVMHAINPTKDEEAEKGKGGAIKTIDGKDLKRKISDIRKKNMGESENAKNKGRVMNEAPHSPNAGEMQPEKTSNKVGDMDEAPCDNAKKTIKSKY